VHQQQGITGGATTSGAVHAVKRNPPACVSPTPTPHARTHAHARAHLCDTEGVCPLLQLPQPLCCQRWPRHINLSWCAAQHALHSLKAGPRQRCIDGCASLRLREREAVPAHQPAAQLLLLLLPLLLLGRQQHAAHGLQQARVAREPVLCVVGGAAVRTSTVTACQWEAPSFKAGPEPTRGVLRVCGRRQPRAPRDAPADGVVRRRQRAGVCQRHAPPRGPHAKQATVAGWHAHGAASVAAKANVGQPCRHRGLQMQVTGASRRASRTYTHTHGAPGGQVELAASQQGQQRQHRPPAAARPGS
jgi:hypothetical protein